MKVLLVQPPVRDFYQTRIRTQPIGLAYLAASLRLEGFEVEILDCQTGRQQPISLPRPFSYLREVYPLDDVGPFRLYSGFYHFGMGWKEIRQAIDAIQPDVVGISSLFTPYHGEALEVARIAKSGDHGRIVIMGGAHVSGDPEMVLRTGPADCVVMGEGEARLPRLLKAIRDKGLIKNVDGVGYWERNRLRINPVEGFIDPVDDIPQPARDLLEPDRYRIGNRRSTMLVTSRGCPHHCAYCSAHLVMGHRFRARSPEAVTAEISECLRRYDITSFDIEDDNFTLDLGRAKRLMELIVERFGERTLHLSAMNGISFASLDAVLLEWMKRAGFDAVNLSFVSTEDLTRKTMNRPGAAEPVRFDEMVEAVCRLGLSAVAYAIFGLPGQSLSEMVDTLIHLMSRRVLIGPSIYYPSPGTPLMARCRQEGLLPPDASMWRSSGFPVQTKDFDRLDLVTLFRLTRWINFFKGKMARGEMAEGLSWRDLFRLSREKEEANSAAWPQLVRLLWEERRLYGLARRADGGLFPKRISSSQRIIDLFLDRSIDRVILRA